MFRQEDRPRTRNRQHVPLRVEGTSLLLGTLCPLFDRRSDSFVAFSQSIDTQLTKLEDHWAEKAPVWEGFLAFLSESPVLGKPKPR